jgi:hypothetical protein
MTIREEQSLAVFVNRVLRILFRPRSDEVTGDWRGLHNEKRHNLNPKPSIIRMIKSSRIRWVGKVAQLGKKRNA